MRHNRHHTKQYYCQPGISEHTDHSGPITMPLIIRSLHAADKPWWSPCKSHELLSWPMCTIFIVLSRGQSPTCSSWKLYITYNGDELMKSDYSWLICFPSFQVQHDMSSVHPSISWRSQTRTLSVQLLAKIKSKWTDLGTKLCELMSSTKTSRSSTNHYDFALQWHT